MRKHVIIVHGLSAAPESNWFMWLKAELEKNDVQVSVPRMPNSSEPDVDNWLAHLGEVVSRVNESTFFVGHSLGCITIAHFLQKLPSSQKAGGCVFVAGFSGNINNPATKAFYQRPLSPKAVIAHSGPIVSIFSEDDEVVPLERAREFTDQLSAKSVIVNGYGHFVGSKGVTELPVALEQLRQLMGIA